MRDEGSDWRRKWQVEEVTDKGSDTPLTWLPPASPYWLLTLTPLPSPLPSFPSPFSPYLPLLSPPLPLLVSFTPFISSSLSLLTIRYPLLLCVFFSLSSPSFSLLYSLLSFPFLFIRSFLSLRPYSHLFSHQHSLSSPSPFLISDHQLPLFLRFPLPLLVRPFALLGLFPFWSSLLIRVVPLCSPCSELYRWVREKERENRQESEKKG